MQHPKKRKKKNIKDIVTYYKNIFPKEVTEALKILLNKRNK